MLLHKKPLEDLQMLQMIVKNPMNNVKALAGRRPDVEVEQTLENVKPGFQI